MKEDAPTPEAVPRKRRQLEQALDRWLAEWLARDDLTPSERRRVEEERDERRRRSGLERRVVGFTGTRAGMTPQQRRRFTELLAGADEFHHGDCLGADEQAHRIAYNLDIPVVIHPPENGHQRAWCKGAVRVEKAKPFLERNHDIVRGSTELIATPKELREPAPGRGQGTWSTVRFARKRGIARATVMPNGQLQEEQ